MQIWGSAIVDREPFTSGHNNCQMQIEPDSLPHLRRFPGGKAAAIQTALEPLLEHPPRPVFTLRWDEEARTWYSRFAPLDELPREVREVFERAGYGCLPVEANVGVVHVCHASDRDVEGFAGKPLLYRWELVRMPTAPYPAGSGDPRRSRQSLPVRVLPQRGPERPELGAVELANQDRLHLAFYGDDLTQRFTHVVEHDEQQWQYLDELVAGDDIMLPYFDAVANGWHNPRAERVGFMPLLGSTDAKESFG